MQFHLVIVEQKIPRSGRPFRILEVTPTCDGPRTRVCEGTFLTIEEAFGMCQQLNAGREPDLVGGRMEQGT